jgi:hypothetical protein
MLSIQGTAAGNDLLNVANSMGSSMLYVQAGGHVGIGTTRPGAELQVSGNTTNPGTFQNADYGQLHINSDGSGNNYVAKITFGGGSAYTVPQAAIGATFNSFGSYLRFGTTNSFGGSGGITNTAMTIDPSGNVGIGTTSPAYPLDVNGDARFSGSDVLFPAAVHFDATSTATPRIGWGAGGNRGISYIYLYPDNVTTSTTTEISTNGSGNTLKIGAGVNVRGGMIDFNGGSAAQNAGTLIFRSGASNGAVDSPERARFDITGNFGIGTTTLSSRLEVWGPDHSASTTAFLVTDNASDTEFAVLDNGNATLAGNLIQNSDQRLKTDITDLDASSSLAEIDALNPVTFNWIDPAKSSAPQFGFIAQQVQPVFPNLVSTTSPTALTPDGTLSLNYIDLISPIVAAIQELDREITSLASTVAGFAQSITTDVLNATTVNAHQLCLDGTCVTATQLAALLAAANQSASVSASPSSSTSNATGTPPVIAINGDNPAVIQIGASYTDLGATITGPQADLNLGIQTYLNGALESGIVLDTSAAATDTIDYVAIDQNGLIATSTRTVIVEPAADPSTSPSAATSSSSTSTPQ